ncbi:hypothetical protein H310_13334 [Aphanomyces invadans]|uniref:Uncharacterized protein n=1 Tax=Aphanomyces invadans TaxID=157072 RepID=A0A024TE23_9STRA|nr:hypothetical protein H310_13334 [Aphanomyces invadans]ETV92269.1 hypothetical protein H310_13334 [Aphanomyces invadans]|eukprot:XP_008879020.1 hypothetical protein H310_13334 [Aphanomyces invadans]
MMVDIEDRLYPVTAEDCNTQLQALKTRHRDVSLEEIAQVVMKALNRPLTADDKMLLEAPANIDDPERWLAWFTRALATCEEARTANRNFESNRGGIVATTRCARMERKGLGLCRKAFAPSCLDLDPYQQASAASIRRQRLRRAELKRTSMSEQAMEPGLAAQEDNKPVGWAHYAWPFAAEDLDVLLDAAPGRQEAVLPKPNATLAGVVSPSEAPIIQVYVDGRLTTALPCGSGASEAPRQDELW